VKDGQVILQGNITATDGTDAAHIEKSAKVAAAADLGVVAAKEILASGGQAIADRIKQKGSIDAGI
jgi:porphobilinogen deaminase